MGLLSDSRATTPLSSGITEMLKERHYIQRQDS